MLFTLKNLQTRFNETEENVRERLEGLPIYGYYKKVLQEMMNIDEQVFEMLYDDDIENRYDYDIEPEALIEAFEKLEEMQLAG